MSERFFLDTPPRDGRAELSGDEARHLARVLRAKVGDTVSVFDGRGRAWPARVATLGRDRVGLDLGPVVEVAPPARPLTIAVALPKGDRQKWMVEKLTELGCTRLVPLVTTRGVAEATSAAVQRLTRSVVEACKQCGRNTLLEIGSPLTVAEVLAARDAATLALIADPEGDPLGPLLAHHTNAVLALVGPEGGFTAEELAVADAAGCRRVSLGPHVLRVETAAIALAAGIWAMSAGRDTRATAATTGENRLKGGG
ncbi:MAG: RsmE family RNA methyltransferase [Planctomycetia bacterium]